MKLLIQTQNNDISTCHVEAKEKQNALIKSFKVSIYPIYIYIIYIGGTKTERQRNRRNKQIKKG